MTSEFFVIAYLLVIAILIGLGIRYRPGRPYLFTAAAVMFVVPVALVTFVVAVFVHDGI